MRLVGACVLSLTLTGCVELAALITGVIADNVPAVSSGDTTPFPGDVPDSDVRPRAQLSVSNLSPFAGEEVVFRCSFDGGDSAGVTYDFQSNSDRLAVDADRGTATLVVDQSDVGVEIAVSCTVTASDGVSEPSNVIILIPQARTLVP